MKGRAWLTNLILFCDKMTCFVNEGKAVYICLDFNKALDTCFPYSSARTGCSWLGWVQWAGWLGPESVGEEKSGYQSHRHTEPDPTGHGDTFYFQILVSAAWGVLPHSIHNYLAVLPSMFSGKLQLKNSSNRALLADMMSGVKQGDPGTFLNIE